METDFDLEKFIREEHERKNKLAQILNNKCKKNFYLRYFGERKYYLSSF